MKKDDVITKEQATTELKAFYEDYHEEEVPDEFESVFHNLIKNMCKGRVVADNEKTIILLEPKHKVEGIETVTVKPLLMNEMKSVFEAKSQFAMTEQYIKKCNPSKVGALIDRMSQQDFVVLAEAMGFFMGAPESVEKK